MNNNNTALALNTGDFDDIITLGFATISAVIMKIN